MQGFSTQDIDILNGVKGHKEEEGIGTSFISGKAGRTGIVHPRADKAQMTFIHIYIPKGKCREDRTRLFPVVPSGRTRHHGNKAECRRVPLNVRNFFPAKVNLVQAAHGSCVLPILGDIPGHGPGTPALVALTEQDVGPVGHESCPSLSGCFCLSVTGVLPMA